jgi:hypothetical protein
MGAPQLRLAEQGKLMSLFIKNQVKEF